MKFRFPRARHPRSGEGAGSERRSEWTERLRADAAAISGPSPALRGNVMRAVRAEPGPATEARERDARSSPFRLRLVGAAAAAALALLLWDPFRSPGPAPAGAIERVREAVSALVPPAAAPSIHDVVDRPLREEMGYLVTDAVGIAEGVAHLSDSVLRPFLGVGRSSR